MPKAARKTKSEIRGAAAAQTSLDQQSKAPMGHAQANNAQPGDAQSSIANANSNSNSNSHNDSDSANATANNSTAVNTSANTTSNDTNNSNSGSSTTAQPLSKVRIQRAVRDQIEMVCMSLDQKVPSDHFVRRVDIAVKALDLTKFYNSIKAREDAPGRPAVDPRMLVTLLVTATIEGISSDRHLARLCERDIIFQWICGGVSINHHLISNFRAADPDRLEQVIVGLISVLLNKDLVDLNCTAQDGMRVRASAGSGSFKTRSELEQSLVEAQKRYDELQAKRDADPDGESEDSAAQYSARKRAAAAMLNNIKEALKQLPEVEARVQKRQSSKKSGEKPVARCSTTDPEAPRMKMADGGTRPAYNLQLATTDKTRFIVGWHVTNAGSDSGLMSLMVNQIYKNYGRRPKNHLTDGGFSSNKDRDEVESHHTKVYSPVKAAKNKIKKGVDPYAPQKGDSEATAEWRRRMGTEHGKEIYRKRGSIAEFPNAVLRNNGLQQFKVRGLDRVKSVSLWHILAFDISRIISLGWLNELTTIS